MYSGIKQDSPEIFKLQGDHLQTAMDAAGKVASRLPGIVDADDLVQHGILSINNRYDKYNPAKGNFESFAYVTARGAMIDLIRHEKMHARRRVHQDQANEMSHGDTTLQAVGQTMDNAQLEEALSRLRAKGRETLEKLFGLTGYVPRSIRVLAKEEGVTINAVKQRNNKSYKALKEIIDRESLTTFE